jgi:hypothetical protein
MGVIGAPIYLVGAIRSICKYLSHISIEKILGLPVPNVLTMGAPYKAAPIRFFKFVWGLPAGTEDPKNEVVDNLPRYGR